MTPEQKAFEIKRLAAIINHYLVFIHVIKWPPQKKSFIGIINTGFGCGPCFYRGFFILTFTLVFLSFFSCNTQNKFVPEKKK